MTTESSNTTQMGKIGRQVRLPHSTAVQISIQGIRIRLGRALVTIAGVILGIAFFMSVLTGEMIKRTVSQEQKLRQSVKLMLSLVQSEVGALEGKSVAVGVLGDTTPEERAFLQALQAEGGRSIQRQEFANDAIPAIQSLGRGADLLVLLGTCRECPVALSEMTAGMSQKVVLDSLAARTFAGAAEGVRRELFFGEKHQQEARELEEQAAQDRFRTIWILTISLLVTVIGISNALLMSVTERFKEIGTMKCLGALSSFIRQLFLIESSIIGFVGSACGVLLGILIPMLLYGATYGFPLVLGSMNYLHLAAAGGASLLLGTLLSIVAALYPAQFAARMVPAMALRSNV